MKKIFALTAALLVALFSSPNALALRSTKVDGHTDPEYVGYKPKKVLVVVHAGTTEMRLITEERLVERLGDFGVEASTERRVFPPTREWTPEMRVEILKRQEFDSTLIVAAGANSSSVIPYARQTYGTANTSGQVHGNGAFNAQTNASTTSYDLVIARSSAEFSSVLVENGSGNTIWYGDILTKAGGTLFVGEKGDAKASVRGVIEGLQEAGHLEKQKRPR